MTSNGNHLMSEACLCLHQSDPLKRSSECSMTSRPAKVASNLPVSVHDQDSRTPHGISRRPPHHGGRRRTLSPVREGSSLTDAADGSEGSGLRKVTSDPESKTGPLSQNDSAPLSPTSKETVSTHSTPGKMDTGEEDAAEGSSSSAPDEPLEYSLPQHALDESAPAEAQYDVVLRRNKYILLKGISLMTGGGSLTLINLSRRGLKGSDAKLLKRAMHQNPHLSVLKLAYNDLGDEGAATIASGFVVGSGHHKNLSVLDMGFNRVGDEGCAALALHAVAGNHTLGILYLSGNNIKEKGTLSLAGAMLHGCSLTALHLSANQLGAMGIQALARAVAENEACRHNGSVSPDQSESRTMEELYLGDASMTANGFVPIPSMLLTNLSLRVLCLTRNGIDDQSMALLSQALSRNKKVPLESVQLSFNEITCAGVECFMNAIWGSETLRELKLDNNKIRDRGAQLAAVVLTSVDLEVLDIGFNRVTNVGIKALMKSLSETSSLQSLSLAGIPLDPTACKAVSYALAYCSSLRAFHVDNCQVGYSGQRHIVAGIVSNRRASLRVLTGFELGAIAVTLQLPQVIEGWRNEKVLRFVRFMWKEWNNLQADTQRLNARKPPTEGNESEDSSDKEGGEEEQIGPADPKTVVAAARKGLALIGENLDSSLHTEPYEREISETSPVVPANATMLERTKSGTIRVPPLVEANRDLVTDVSLLDLQSRDQGESSSGDDGTLSRLKVAPLDPLRKNRNLEWLRAHFRSLNEISQLPFNSADLWQLHQYFFSPALPPAESRVNTDSLSSSDTSSSDERPEDTSCSAGKSRRRRRRHSRTPQCSPMPSNASLKADLGRSISFQMLGEATMSACSSMNIDSLHKRGPSDEEEEMDNESMSAGPATKRAKSFKPRIAYYPRIREKLEAMGAKPSQEQTLSLLRLLKFVESVMFQGKNPFTDNETIRDPEQPSPADVEMIILDLL